jgi:hypothetical protein
MKINPDGSFDLANGETVPFICPRDGWPIEYDDKILMVHCFHCGYIGSREEFSQEVVLKEDSESYS